VDKVSSPVLLAMAATLSFFSAFGGALLALALDSPEVVVTERVVEVAPATPPEISEADLFELRNLYVEMTGEDVRGSLGLVHEIGGRVCNGGAPSATEVLDSFGPDMISMNPVDFEAFVEQVRAVCRS
jgi:hypothetical protein